jgi:hypothetical protein
MNLFPVIRSIVLVFKNAAEVDHGGGRNRAVLVLLLPDERCNNRGREKHFSQSLIRIFI